MDSSIKLLDWMFLMCKQSIESKEMPSKDQSLSSIMEELIWPFRSLHSLSKCMTSSQRSNQFPLWLKMRTQIGWMKSSKDSSGQESISSLVLKTQLLLNLLSNLTWNPLLLSSKISLRRSIRISYGVRLPITRVWMHMRTLHGKKCLWSLISKRLFS